MSPGTPRRSSWLAGSDIRGLGVHVAARIMASAGEGEILVSSVVKDLSLGSSLVFAPRGSHSLKGVPGEWSLFAASIAASEDMQHGRRIAGLRIVDPFRDD